MLFNIDHFILPLENPYMIIYGIPNCNSVKKTRDWLAEHHIDYTFHDFKKLGIDEATLRQWLKFVPLNELINKKGTTWRGLSTAEQAMADDENTAIELMLSKTSVIKRPIVVTDKIVFVGHKTDLLEEASQ